MYLSCLLNCQVGSLPPGPPGKLVCVGKMLVCVGKMPVCGKMLVCDKKLSVW